MGASVTPKARLQGEGLTLAPELIKELKKWRLACPPSELDLVFPNTIGRPENAAGMLYRSFFPALTLAKLPRIRFHQLRHTFASLLIDQGEHPKYIHNQLGHSSIQVTMDIYGHLMETANQKATSRLGRAVFGDSEFNGRSLAAQKAERG
jgi:integrase